MNGIAPVLCDDAMPVGITVNGENLVADLSGALWHPARRALLVADLHLEKGSSFARSGQFVPPYDSIATLARLAAVAARWRAQTIYFLGDAFHDPFAGERIDIETRAALASLASGRHLVWIAGNHDPSPPAQVAGERVVESSLGNLVLRHIPSKKPEPGEVAGHLHPVARVATRAALLRRRCFVHDDSRIILPAFGAYAGGLSVRDPAIADLFAAPRVLVLGERRVLPMPGARIV